MYVGSVCTSRERVKYEQEIETWMNFWNAKLLHLPDAFEELQIIYLYCIFVYIHVCFLYVKM